MKTFCVALVAVVALSGCAVTTDGEMGPRGGNYPYAAKAKDNPGFVVSPFNKTALIDVRGFPKGTQVTDPWTGKIFLVP